MASRISNTNGKRVGYVAWDLSDDEVGATIVLRVLPTANYRLEATPVDLDCQIQARENGTADPWVDIGVTPIQLSGYTPEVWQAFDFRAVALSPLVDVRRVAIFLGVVSNGAVAW